ncbi:MAG: hypothetical protein IJ493_13055 [Clostridia bacterium]|nr:hypothetical protein [Clostridia bacterium]
MSKTIQTKRTLTAILTMAMLASFTACGDTAEPSADTTTTTAADTTVSAETVEVCELPDTDWEEQEFRVLGMLNSRSYFCNFEIDMDEETGDVVNDAIYHRNTAIEERYNVTITQILSESPKTDLVSSVFAGEDNYDLTFQAVSDLPSIMTSGCLYDLNQISYIDFDKSWWNADVNEALEIGGSLYFTTSDFSLRDKSRAYMLAYNANIVEDYNIGNLSQLALEGKWTIDKMNECGRIFASDVDQNGSMNMSDKYSVGCASYGDFACYVVAQGNRIISKDDSGELSIVMNSEHMINSIDKVLQLLDRSVSMYCNDFQGIVDGDMWTAHSTLFKQEQALFRAAMLPTLQTLSSAVNFDYRILPMPKYDEEQEQYYTMSDGWALMFGIPVSVSDPDFSGFMLEALSYESQSTTLPAYYETSCKTKYTYDENSPILIDMIMDGIVYDFGMIYSVGGLDEILNSTIPSKGENVFSSAYASAEPAALADLESLIEELSSVE